MENLRFNIRENIKFLVKFRSNSGDITDFFKKTNGDHFPNRTQVF